MRSKLLITGGLGYVGSFTAKKFLKVNKYKAFSIDNLSRGNKFSEKFSKNIMRINPILNYNLFLQD